MLLNLILFKCCAKLNILWKTVILTSPERFISVETLITIMARKESGIWLKLTGAGSAQPDSMFDIEQLAIGIKVEMEHTRSIEVAKAIAKDHLVENSRYYTYLIAMEQELKSGDRIKEVYGW